MFFKIGLLLNFPISARKYVLESLFNKVTDLMACNSIKKETSTQVFPVNITKCLRTAFLMEHLRWLRLKMVEEFLKLRISNST